MTLTRTADWSHANGTCLQGYVSVTFGELVDAFGEPEAGDGYKTQAEWVLKTEDGCVATIYDWKYDGTPIEDITEWNIGGFDKRAVDEVHKALGLRS